MLRGLTFKLDQRMWAGTFGDAFDETAHGGATHPGIVHGFIDALDKSDRHTG